MNITGFDPFIAAAKTDETVKLFKALGFEHRHTKKGIEIADRDETVIRMKDANGNSLDILQTDAEMLRGAVGIRMNVDDFDKAYETLLQHGFKNAYGDKTVDTKTSKAAMMISPSGFCISIIRHIKE